MSSTFLKLTNDVLRQLNETELTSSNFSSATDMAAVSKDAVNTAIAEILQKEIFWPFQYTTQTDTLSAGDYDVNIPADAQEVDWDNFTLVADVPTSVVDHKHLPRVDYDVFVQSEALSDIINGGTAHRGEPVYIVPGQNQEYFIYPAPDVAYQITYPYWSFPSELSAYTDTTTIPPRFDYVIRQGALRDCYMFLDSLQESAKWESRFETSIEYMRSLLINRVTSVYDTRVRGNYERALMNTVKN